MFDTIAIESLSGSNAGHATWPALFVESEGAGVGLISNIHVSNIRIRNEGMFYGILAGYNTSSMVSNVTFTDIYTLANTTPGTTLEEMKILDVSQASGIVVVG